MTSLVYMPSMAGVNQAAIIEHPPNAMLTRNIRVKAFEYACCIPATARPMIFSLTPGSAAASSTSPALRYVSSGSIDATGKPASARAGATMFFSPLATLLVRIVEKMAARSSS